MRKAGAEKALNEMEMLAPYTSIDQLDAAKRAAKELLKTLPGPFVRINFSGHANGVGWQKKAGYANDMITVSVSQVCHDDLTPEERIELDTAGETDVNG